MGASRDNPNFGVSAPLPDADDDALRPLWDRHRAGDRAAYEALVEAHLPLVKATVGRLVMNVPPHISREELYAAGCYGLVSAFDRFNPDREAKFSTYAVIRIRGAVLDELRSHDFLGRAARDRLTRIARAEAELRQQESRADPESVAAAAGLSMDEYWEAELSAQAARRVSLSDVSANGRQSLEEILASRRDDRPDRQLETAELVRQAVDLLTDREKILVSLYYGEELTLKEIGEVMGVSESRVCQMHTAMIKRLRSRLGDLGLE